jgi:hypothetical protein
MKLLLASILMLTTLFLVSCGQKQTGPADVKWDRTACDRCQMMLSDRKFSAQVRVFPKEKRSKVYQFDDIGCATLWLDKTDWEGDPKTQIWVTDYKTGDWINARTANYVKDQLSPMNYGLGATNNETKNTLTFKEAKSHIKEVESKLNIHGGNFSH